jgi:RNA polymerase sigma-70 factor (ECF subfamily)
VPAAAAVERLPGPPAPHAEAEVTALTFAGDPDAELVTRWLGGEQGAFETLVTRHHARVFRFLVRMLGDAQEAEDVLQETFLNVHRHGRRFRGEARFSTFLYRAAANGALNRRRGLGRGSARLLRLFQRQAVGHDLPAAPRDPEAAAQSAQTAALVQAALLEIPVRLRLPLVLYDVEGLSYREIAEAVQVREGTVKSRIHRARRLLRERLRPLLGGHEDRS